MNKKRYRRLLQYKLKPGVLIKIAGYSGSSHLNSKKWNWVDYRKEGFVYMIISKVKTSSDDYIVLSRHGKLERLFNITDADSLDFL